MWFTQKQRGDQGFEAGEAGHCAVKHGQLVWENRSPSRGEGKNRKPDSSLRGEAGVLPQMQTLTQIQSNSNQQRPPTVGFGNGKGKKTGEIYSCS